MEQNQVQINQLSDIQLKAIAYDELGKIEQAQANLRVINTELANRAKAASQTVVDNNPEIVK
jgi:hypothetical protein